MDTNKTGRSLFWAGFILTVAVVAGFIVMMLIGVAPFTTWVSALTLCGLVLVGTLLMYLGRAFERGDGSGGGGDGDDDA